MNRSKILILSAILVAGQLFVSADTAQAGPLLDWLRGRSSNSFNRQQAAYNYYGNQPNTVQLAETGHNPAGLQPGQCMRTCNKTCTRTVVNYVPYTAYRTNWNRVPVTSYRPVTNSDPCTGCTVTCMRPCTTYTYQAQRVPYTTYRPVYRQEAYQVPVTTITNNCATGGCDSCGTGVSGNVPSTVTPPNFSNPQGSGTSNGTSNFGGSQFETPTFPGTTSPGSPADSAPSVFQGQGSGARVDVDQTRLLSTRANATVPQITIPRDLQRQVPSHSAMAPRKSATAPRRSAMVPIKRKLNYSAVRLASHVESRESNPVRVSVRSTSANKRRSLREINSIWQDAR